MGHSGARGLLRNMPSLATLGERGRTKGRHARAKNLSGRSSFCYSAVSNTIFDATSQLVATHSFITARLLDTCDEFPDAGCNASWVWAGSLLGCFFGSLFLGRWHRGSLLI